MVLVHEEGPTPDSLSARRAELAHNLTRVREQIAQACQAVGRTSTEITLIAVTKTFPASDVALLAALGLHDVAENRDDEARGKAAQLSGSGLRWHFVGKLQRNKCRSVVTYADVVHSVDRPQLIEALARASGEVRQNPLGVLVQVDLDHVGFSRTSRTGRSVSEDPTRRRGGVSPGEAIELAGRIRRYPEFVLLGVMGIAPQHGDSSAAFSQLREVSHRLRALEETASWVSAGMSGDLAQAVAAGATHVRVGSALLGIR